MLRNMDICPLFHRGCICRLKYFDRRTRRHDRNAPMSGGRKRIYSSIECSELHASPKRHSKFSRSSDGQRRTPSWRASARAFDIFFTRFLSMPFCFMRSYGRSAGLSIALGVAVLEFASSPTCKHQRLASIKILLKMLTASILSKNSALIGANPTRVFTTIASTLTS